MIKFSLFTKKSMLLIVALTLSVTASNAQPSWGLNPSSGTILSPGISVVSSMAQFNNVHPFPPYAPNGDPSTGFNMDTYVLTVVDVRNRPATGPDNWNAPKYVNDSWKFSNIGSIFGLATDNNENIYVTATSSFSSGYMINGRNGTFSGTNGFQPLGITPYGFGGPGAVYKINAVTGAVTLFASLPQQSSLPIYDQSNVGPVVQGTDTFYYANDRVKTGPGLGNIAYDWSNNQFFVSNMEDGRIYRISNTGTVLGAYDPLMPDNGLAGFAPLGERIWGLGVKGNRLFYSVWVENNGNRNAISQNEIRSVKLDASGNFISATDQLEVTMPSIAFPGTTYSNPVSDIEFSQNGKMLVSERTMLASSALRAHAARVLEFSPLAGSSWSVPKEFHAGSPNPDPRNSTSGGSDYGYLNYSRNSGVSGCDSILWMGADAMRFSLEDGFPLPPGFTFYGIFGIQGTPVTGNTRANLYTSSNFVDIDNLFNAATKAQMGDVDVFRVYPMVSGASVSEVCIDKPFTLSANVKDNPPFIVTPFTYQWYREEAPGTLIPVGSLGTIPSGTGSFSISTTLTGTSGDVGKRFFIKLNYDGNTCSVLDSTKACQSGKDCCPNPKIGLTLSPDNRVIGSNATITANVTGITAPFTYRFFREDSPGVRTPITVLNTVSSGVDPFVLSYSFVYAAIDLGNKKYILEINKEGCIAEAGILPVELTSFTANLDYQIVSLNWSTASEVNNAGFEIERNYNGIWEKIGFIKGFGTTYESHIYKETNDVSNLIENQVAFVDYRLKIMDIDGKSNYSDSRRVLLSKNEEFGVTLSQNIPNPFNKESVIEYSVKNEGRVALDIYDMQGKFVSNLANGVKLQGKYKVTLNSDGLNSGMYYYRLNVNGKILMKSLAITK